MKRIIARTNLWLNQHVFAIVCTLVTWWQQKWISESEDQIIISKAGSHIFLDLRKFRKGYDLEKYLSSLKDKESRLFPVERVMLERLEGRFAFNKNFCGNHFIFKTDGGDLVMMSHKLSCGFYMTRERPDEIRFSLSLKKVRTNFNDEFYFGFPL